MLRRMPQFAMWTLTVLILLNSAVAQQSAAPVALRQLVPSSDPLAVHDLTFDASFARDAVDYLRSNGSAVPDRMAHSKAIAHILAHARNFDYDVPQDSPQSLVNSLLGSKDKQPQRVETCEQGVAFFSGPMLQDPHWVADALDYLPKDFRFRGTLFLTFGYDIGVAFGSNASLNCTHPHFKDHPRELLYYAIHELHHTGFMSYQKPPKLADIKTCADLLRLVEYSTQMEGMAVLAAYERRKNDNALADDPDYVALTDPVRMQAELASYSKDYLYLKTRGTQPADPDAWAVITRMSSGERLWYRVGALMAQRIEKEKGRAALADSVKQTPAQFVAAYESLSEQAAGFPQNHKTK